MLSLASSSFQLLIHKFKGNIKALDKLEEAKLQTPGLTFDCMKEGEEEEVEEVKHNRKVQYDTSDYFFLFSLIFHG